VKSTLALSQEMLNAKIRYFRNRIEEQ